MVWIKSPSTSTGWMDEIINGEDVMNKAIVSFLFLWFVGTVIMFTANYFGLCKRRKKKEE